MTAPNTPAVGDGSDGQFRELLDLAEYLAYEHQMGQQHLAAKTAAGLALLWPILDFHDLDKKTPQWLHAATLQIEQSYRASSALSNDLVQGMKWAVDPLSAPIAKVDPVFPVDAVQRAMGITGPVSVKKLSGSPNSVSPDEMMTTGLSNSTGAGVANALNGGRRTVQMSMMEQAAESAGMSASDAMSEAQAAVEAPGMSASDALSGAETAIDGAVSAPGSESGSSSSALQDFLAKHRAWQSQPSSDETIVDYLQDQQQRKAAQNSGGSSDFMERQANRKPQFGYKRMTDDKPCYFCAILASKGNFYINPKWASDMKYDGSGDAKVHNHCRCMLVPVFSQSERYDSRARYFLSQWVKYTRQEDGTQLGGRVALNEFRRNYVPPPPYKAPLVDLAGVRANRDALLSRGYSIDSKQVEWFDEQLKKLAG